MALERIKGPGLGATDADSAGVPQSPFLQRSTNAFRGALDRVRLSLLVLVDHVPQFLVGADGIRRGHLARAAARQVLDEFAAGAGPILRLGRHGPPDGPIGALR